MVAADAQPRARSRRGRIGCTTRSGGWRRARRSIRRAQEMTAIAGDDRARESRFEEGLGRHARAGARAGRRPDRRHALGAVRRGRARARDRLRQHRQPAARAIGERRQRLRAVRGVRRRPLGADSPLAGRKQRADRCRRRGRAAVRVVGHARAAAADSGQRAARATASASTGPVLRVHRRRRRSRQACSSASSRRGARCGRTCSTSCRRPARGSTSGRGTRRLSNVMVGAEVALALMLLVSAGLLDPQLRAPHVRRSGLSHVGHRRRARRAAQQPLSRSGVEAAVLRSSCVERVRALPGVTRASAVSALPMSALGVQFDLPFTIDGVEAVSPTERPRARYRAVISDYFQTMGIELKKGRVFDDFDGRENGTERRDRQRIDRAAVLRRRRSDRPSGEDPDGRRSADRRRCRGHQARRPAGHGAGRGVRPVFPVSADRDADRHGVGGGSPRRSRGRQERDGRARSGAADREGVDDRGSRVRVDRAAALQHDAAGGAGALRGAARRGRRLRRRELFGGAAHVGDRRAHGARRRRGHAPSSWWCGAP